MQMHIKGFQGEKVKRIRFRIKEDMERSCIYDDKQLKSDMITAVFEGSLLVRQFVRDVYKMYS